ncbi:Ent-kaurene synthase [Apiospora marii]|uniref:Ent-kaurene synthase n=1 Tax=Apiospora marii TaxID=335849 RepID=A0ABR1RG25_9PEZI
MQTQEQNGSWVQNGASNETTGYSVLTLKSVASLPWLVQSRPRIDMAIQRGCDYLIRNQSRWEELDRIWVGKTTYTMPMTSRRYIIAALVASSSYEWSEKVHNLITLPQDRLKSIAKFFLSMPMFGQDELWVLEADVLSGWLYQPQLARAIAGIFPQRDKACKKYLAYVPFTWLATNRRQENPLSPKDLYEMMLVSLCTFQLDEFMETCFDDRMGLEDNNEAKMMLKELCEFGNGQQDRNGEGKPREINGNGNGNGNGNIIGNGNGSNNGNLGSSISALHSLSQEVRTVLHRFTSYILSHPAVTQAPDHVHQQQLKQLRSNGSTAPAVFEPAQHLTYHAWVQAVGAKKIEAPWPFFVGARQNYLANALSQHLAAYCRQYNDYGSVTRDRDEGNLNSLDFPDFLVGPDDGVRLLHPQPRGETAKEVDLLAIADFERESVDSAMDKLGEELRRGWKGEEKFKALKAYVNTVELYRQIYVVRDISNQKMGQVGLV